MAAAAGVGLLPAMLVLLALGMYVMSTGGPTGAVVVILVAALMAMMWFGVAIKAEEEPVAPPMPVPQPGPRP
jgi:hypothetical protein